MNFHFISWMGNARQTPQLGLTSASILKAQEELEIRHRAGLIPLRYPRLLVPESELQPAISQGLSCRLAGAPRLIFPDGQMLHCPLEIADGSETQTKQGSPREFNGCPLAWRLLPDGIPTGYRMTCISWKPSRAGSS